MLYAKFPWIKLASAGAGLGQLSVAFAEERLSTWVGGGPVAQRAPAGSAPSAMPGCCGIGRSRAQGRWALPNPHFNA